MGSELPIARAMASAMELTDQEDEVAPDAVLATMTDASDDCEATTPTAKLLSVERGGGMLRRQPTPKKSEARPVDQRRENTPKSGRRSCKTMNHVN